MLRYAVPSRTSGPSWGESTMEKTRPSKSFLPNAPPLFAFFLFPRYFLECRPSSRSSPSFLA
eukprot:763456-Hanusia_phi.AAC.1